MTLHEVLHHQIEKKKGVDLVKNQKSVRKLIAKFMILKEVSRKVKAIQDHDLETEGKEKMK